MKAEIKRLLPLGFLLVLFTLVPVSAQPGSEEDPLVSQKYVDERIGALEAMISQAGNGGEADASGQRIPPAAAGLTPELRGELLAEALAGFESVYGDMLRQAAGNAGGAGGDYPPQTPPADVPSFEVVFAESGSVLYFDSGAELILRGGSAAVLSGVDGICDVTSGADLVNGREVPHNHLLVVPVGDGRGVRVYDNAYLMIKGGYYFG